MGGQTEGLLRHLELFGLSRLQAKVYLSLYTLGEAPANRVAEMCQIHRVEAYRVLKELLKTGAIDRVIAHPARYRAKRPEEVLKILLSPFVEQMSELSEAKGRILRDLSLMPFSVGDSGLEDGFELLQGRQALKRMVTMIDQASDEILFCMRIHREGLEWVLGPFNRALERGVSARGLLNIGGRDVEAVKGFKRSRRMVRRHSDKVYSWCIVVDGRELIFSSAPTAQPDETFLYTRDRKFVGHHIQSFNLLFRDGAPIGRRVRELDAMKVSGEIRGS